MRPRIIPAQPPWARELFTLGVTGTNGKTTTTTWLAAALRTAGAPVIKITTLGFFVDDEELPLEKSYDGFLEAMREGLGRGARFAAIELTSEALAQGFARAWPCQIGIFTNLSHDHLDAHGSAEHYLASKAQLFLSLPEGGAAVLNGRDEASSLLRGIIPPGVRVLTYGVASRGGEEPADLEAGPVKLGWSGTRFGCVGPGGTAELSVRGIGEIYAENAMAALLGAMAAGVDASTAREAIARAEPPPGRFEVVADSPHVIVDFAHSPDALARTVATARTLASADEGGGRVLAVLGAGGNRDVGKRAPMGQAVSLADRVVLTTDNPRDEDPAAIARAIAAGLEGHPGVTLQLDRRAAIAVALAEASPRDIVLVCGRGHEREQLVGQERRAFSDVDVVRELLAARRATSDQG